jgi:hypothetical protein
MYPFPTALPAGWTNPAAQTFPATASTTQLIMVNNGFTSIVGLTAGTYPAVIQATTFSQLSTSVPQVTPVQSQVVSCNLLNNKLSVPNNILYSFSSGATTFGSLITSAPPEFYFVDIQNGYYPHIIIEFFDQNLSKLNILDTNIIITLLIYLGEGRKV